MIAAWRQPWLLLGALAVLLAALPLCGQGSNVGAFVGSVLDEEGQPLEGARVIIRGVDFNLERETQTDEAGRFYHGGFRPGRYHVIVLRERRVLWSFSVTLPLLQEELRLDINLKALREAAEKIEPLDPELERQREADLQRRQYEETLQRHFNRAARHLRVGQPEQAIEEYEAALTLEPDRGVLYALLAAATAAAGRREEAIQLYRRALQFEPYEAAHHNNLGTLLVRSGELEQALAHFDKAAELDSDPSRAATYQFNRGAALLNSGRPAEALRSLRQATRSDPTFAAAHYFLGLALFRTSPPLPEEQGPGRVEPRPGTIEAFQRYLQLEPEGEYAETARDYLKQFGALPSEMLLPELPPTGLDP